MKRGDVFKIRGDKQMYFADTVTPSGSVFAHRFDIDKGTYDEPVSFPSNTIAKILFNTYEPEQEDGWEYCKIVQKLYLEQGFPSKEWLEAEVEGESNVHSVGKSQVIGVLRGEPMLGYQNEKHRAILKKLVKRLAKDGWQVVPQRRHIWFELRFKRSKTQKKWYERFFKQK